MAPVRILVVSPSLPVPFLTTDGRWVYVLAKGLASRGHDLTCVSCTPDDAEAVEAAQALASSLGFCLRHVPLRVQEPLLIRKLRSLRLPKSELQRSPGFNAVVEDELEREPDIVHVEHLFHARSLLGLEKLVVYVHCLETIDWCGRTDLTMRERLDRRLMGRAVNHVLERADRVITISERLRIDVLGTNPRLATATVPMGLDLSLYEPGEPVDEPVLGLAGSMSWYPSRSAAERILLRLWPAIRRRVPEARLLIGGWDAHRYLGRQARLAGVQLLDAFDHPVDFFSRIGALLYPTAGGTGMKVKTLEAMAYGLPVISNADGFEGLQIEDGVNGVAATTDEEFVEAAVQLLEDPARRQEIGRRARVLVERHYSADAAVDQLLDAYDAVFDRATSVA